MQAVAHRDLVFRIAHREHAGYGERVSPALAPGDRSVERGKVQWLALVSGRVVATGDPNAGIATQRAGDAGTGRRRFVEADEHEPDPPALALDERVGGQRRGERDERDGTRVDPRTRQHRLRGTVDADCEIVSRGERLRARDDLSRPLVEQHRVGIRTSGVDAEQDWHGCAPAVR